MNKITSLTTIPVLNYKLVRYEVSIGIVFFLASMTVYLMCSLSSTSK